MVITTQRGRGEKVHVFFDGEYTITTDINFWYDNSVRDDDVLDEEECETLLQKINVKKAINKAYDYLAVRDHSRLELFRKMAKKFDSDIINTALEKVEENGYIDDEKFARKFAKHLIENKMFSYSRAKQELRSKGIDNDTIELALDDIEIDPIEQIVTLVEKKYSKKLDNEKDYQRTVNALLRLGYSYSDIKSAFYRYNTNEE